MPYYTQPAHTACQTQDWLRANCTDFIAKDEWPQIHQTSIHLTIMCSGVQLFQAFHKLHLNPKTILELKSALQQIWDGCRRQRSTKLLTTFANV